MSSACPRKSIPVISEFFAVERFSITIPAVTKSELFQLIWSWMNSFDRNWSGIEGFLIHGARFLDFPGSLREPISLKRQRFIRVLGKMGWFSPWRASRAGDGSKSDRKVFLGKVFTNQSGRSWKVNFFQEFLFKWFRFWKKSSFWRKGLRLKESELFWERNFSQKETLFPYTLYSTL